MTDARVQIVDVAGGIERFPLRSAWVYGKGEINSLIRADVRLRVRDCATGREATGRGQMTLSASWAYPSAAIDLQTRETAMIEVVDRFGRFLTAWGEAGHPIDLHYESQADLARIGREVGREHGLADPIPPLALMVCASPFDLAVHDAYGRLHDASSYALLGPEHMSHDLGRYLGPSFAGLYPGQFLRRPPARRVAIAHTVAAADALGDQELPLDAEDDGLPRSLHAWIRRDGVRTIKLKLTGDLLADVERTIAVAETAAACGREGGGGDGGFTLSIDPNEQYSDVDAVVAMLHELRGRSPLAWRHLMYVEQPTPRGGPAAAVDHSPIAAIKPVIADEGVTDPAALLDAFERGWSGVGLKACKGLSACLLFNAAACRMDKLVTVQDLTTTGLAYIAGVGLAAHAAHIGALEANGRQFAPNANAAAAAMEPAWFDVRAGTVDANGARRPGLGYGRAVNI